MAVHPNSLANLKPVQPGEVRNPEGRKTAGAYIKEHMNSLALAMEKGELNFEALQAIATNDPNGNRRTAAIRLVRAIEPVESSLPEFREIMDRTEGKATQPISGDGGGPVVHELRVKFDE